MHELHLVPRYSTNQINCNQAELEKLLTHTSTQVYSTKTG